MEFPGCESVTGEDSYCLALSDDQIVLVGLGSGAVCPVVSTGVALDGLVSASMAWIGEDAYFCDPIRGLLRASLRDGSVEDAGVSCWSVAEHRGGLLVSSLHENWTPDSGLRWFKDYSAAKQGDVGREYSVGFLETRMTTAGDALYTASRSNRSIEVGDLATDSRVGVLTLDDFDDLILGIAVTNDDILVLSRDGEILLFDARTGLRMRALPVVGSLAGLSCVSAMHRTPPPVPSPPSTPTPSVGPCGTSSPNDRCGAFGCAEIIASLPQRPRADFPPSIGINCGDGGVSSNYVHPEADPNAAAEMHVIGVYQGKGNPGFRVESQGAVDVRVRPSEKPIVLFLSAYESTLWNVEIDPGARVERVITQGYGAQEVSGVPNGVALDRMSPEETCGNASGWEVEHGSDYHVMVAAARQRTGLTESSFQGCHSGGAFEIPYWNGDPPTERPPPVLGDETILNTDMIFPGCDAITAEHEYCLTITEGALALLGLESGEVCEVTDTSAPIESPLLNSLLWRGDIAYTCSLQGLIRISLRDGSWEAAQLPCGGVAEHQGDLAVMAPFFGYLGWHDSALVYPSYAALLADEFLRELALGAMSFAFAIHGDTVYTATNSAESIQATDSKDGSVRDVPLEGYAGWILGLAATEDGRLIISGEDWGRTVHVFDAQSGRRLRDVTVSAAVRGLACVTRPPAPSLRGD